jgi:sortase A
MTRVRRVLAGLLITAGVLLLADVAATLVWQEPLGALREHRTQRRLARDLRRLDAAPLPRSDLAAAARAKGTRRQVAVLARAYDRRTAAGAAIGRLEIPRLGLRAVVVHGSDLADLARGPGTIDGSPLPGAPGTAAIAGHRTTHGAPFGGIDQLRAGDPVTARMPYATLRYRVTGSRVVEPTDLRVLRRTGHDQLVLVACHPRFSAAHRIVVFARLADVRRMPVRRSSDLFKRTAARPDARADGTMGRH